MRNNVGRKGDADHKFGRRSLKVDCSHIYKYDTPRPGVCPFLRCDAEDSHLAFDFELGNRDNILEAYFSEYQGVINWVDITDEGWSNFRRCWWLIRISFVDSRGSRWPVVRSFVKTLSECSFHLGARRFLVRSVWSLDTLLKEALNAVWVGGIQLVIISLLGLEKWAREARPQYQHFTRDYINAMRSVQHKRLKWGCTNVLTLSNRYRVSVAPHAACR